MVRIFLIDMSPPPLFHPFSIPARYFTPGRQHVTDCLRHLVDLSLELQAAQKLHNEVCRIKCGTPTTLLNIILTKQTVTSVAPLKLLILERHSYLGYFWIYRRMSSIYVLTLKKLGYG